MHILGFTTQYADLSLFLLRVMVAMVFGTSGYHHLQTPKQRAASLGMSVGFTIFLGAAELAAAIGLVLGVLTQLAALGLILIAIGAIFMKAGKWRNGFWGENSMGWHYDLMLAIMNLVILCTGGGRIALFAM
jgi:putative oxidoreductase